MGCCMVSSFDTNWLTISQKLLRVNSARFGLAIREFPSDFQTYIFLKMFCSLSEINLQMFYNSFLKKYFWVWF